MAVTYSIEVKNGSKVIGTTLSDTTMYFIRAAVNSIRTNETHHISIVIQTGKGSDGYKSTRGSLGLFHPNHNGINSHIVYIIVPNLKRHFNSRQYEMAFQEYSAHVLIHELGHTKHWIEDRFGLMSDREMEHYVDKFASRVMGNYSKLAHSYYPAYSNKRRTHPYPR